MTTQPTDSAGMQQIANVVVDVKHRHPGNPAAYIPVAFEIYRDGVDFCAVPGTRGETRKLTNLPKRFSFMFKNGVLGISLQGLEEVVQEIVDILHLLGLMKVPPQYLATINNNNAREY